jgi:hypothetical protein
MLAVAIVLSWQASPKSFWKGVGPLYITNIILNVLWTFVFFSMHELTGAAVTAGILGFSVLVLIFANLKVSKIAAVLLVPYFLWVSFATVLNVQIAAMNVAPASFGTATLPMPVDRLPAEAVSNQVTGYGFTLTTGATKKIDNHLSITLDVVNDSRCPAVEGVVCIWQGELSPQLTVVLDGKSSEVRLGTVTAKEADIGAYHLTLIDAGLESAKIRIDLP